MPLSGDYDINDNTGRERMPREGENRLSGMARVSNDENIFNEAYKGSHIGVGQGVAAKPATPFDEMKDKLKTIAVRLDGLTGRLQQTNDALFGLAQDDTKITGVDPCEEGAFGYQRYLLNEVFEALDRLEEEVCRQNNMV